MEPLPWYTSVLYGAWSLWAGMAGGVVVGGEREEPKPGEVPPKKMAGSLILAISPVFWAGGK